MNPRTVDMAKAVESLYFSTADLENYGNITLNGYLSVVPNTINKKAWQYKETATPPVNLPSLTEVRPALKGWTNNYMEYYTQLLPNTYSEAPGSPTMFEYTVHSFTAANAPKWSQPPHRVYQDQVSVSPTPQNVNNPRVIQYSFMHPVSDSTLEPPIDLV